MLLQLIVQCIWSDVNSSSCFVKFSLQFSFFFSTPLYNINITLRSYWVKYFQLHFSKMHHLLDFWYIYIYFKTHGGICAFLWILSPVVIFSDEKVMEKYHTNLLGGFGFVFNLGILSFFFALLCFTHLVQLNWALHKWQGGMTTPGFSSWFSQDIAIKLSGQMSQATFIQVCEQDYKLETVISLLTVRKDLLMAVCKGQG